MSITEKLNAKRAAEPFECDHDWKKYTQHVRRSLTPAEERRLFKYNQMFPGNDGNQPLSCTFIIRGCAKCKTKKYIGYKVN